MNKVYIATSIDGFVAKTDGAIEIIKTHLKGDVMKSIGRFFLCSTLILLIFNTNTTAQPDSIRTKISKLLDQSDGRVGVAIMTLESQDKIIFNDNHCYPIQSVFKFPLALAVLNEVDKGVLSLDQILHITKDDLLPNTWSPLRTKYPDGNVDLSISELIKVTVAQSDNNGCDILFRLLGGPVKVNEFIHGLGINNISILNTEEEMHKDWSIQYENCSTPTAMAELLTKFYKGAILSPASTKFLLDIMINTVTGKGKIKAQLPEDAKVAHKTGWSGSNKEGLTAANNDVGIISLPNGEHIIIAIFVSDSYRDVKTQENLIADISKLVWDAYSAD